MQFQLLTLLALSAIATANPVPETQNTDEADGVCGTGFTITAWGSDGCNFFNQGSTNSGSGCNVCAEIGDAKAFKVDNPSHCANLEVNYYHGAGCKGNIIKSVQYNTHAHACNVIPTNIGDHFSGRFVCISN